MANLLEVDLKGFSRLLVTESKKPQLSGQYIIGHLSDIKSTIDTKNLQHLAITLNYNNLVDNLKEQIVDIVCKSKLVSYCGPMSLIESISKENKKLILLGYNDGSMRDIVPKSLSVFNNLVHLSLITVTIDYKHFKEVFESKSISILEFNDVSITDVKQDDSISFQKDKLSWYKVEGMDYQLQSQLIMGSTKMLDTDNILLFSSLKGYLKQLDSLKITSDASNSRIIAKSLMMCKNLISLQISCIGATNDQMITIFNAIESEGLEKLVLFPGLKDLSDSMLIPKFKKLNCFGTVVLPLNYSKNLKLSSIYLNAVTVHQFNDLNVAIQNFQLKTIYYTGLPAEIMKFEQDFSQQLQLQNCKVIIESK